MIQKVRVVVTSDNGWILHMACGHILHLKPEEHSDQVCARFCSCCDLERSINKGGSFQDLLNSLMGDDPDGVA